MKSIIKIMICSIFTFSLVFANNQLLQEVSKTELEKSSVEVTTKKVISNDNKSEEINDSSKARPIGSTYVIGQEIPKGVSLDEYTPEFEIKNSDIEVHSSEPYINPDFQSTDSRGQVSVVVRSGGYGSEMAWSLETSDGTTVASGGPYANCGGETISLDLDAGDYVFNAVDTYGDGWNSSYCDTGYGYYSSVYGSFGIFDADGGLLAGTAGNQYSQYVTGSGLVANFTVAPDPLTTVVVRSGGYGSEMAWSLEDSSGATLASGGPYANCSGETLTLVMADGDYVFNAVDTYGDGWNSSYCDSGIEYGSFGIFDSNGVLSAGTAGPQSSIYVTGSGLSVSFTLNTAGVPGCTDSSACNFDSSATIDDSSCVIPSACDTCEDTCSDGISTDQTSCEEATCSGIDSWDDTAEGCDNSSASTLTWTAGVDASCTSITEINTGNVDSCYPNDGACDDGYSWCGYEYGVDCTDCGNCPSEAITPLEGWDDTQACDNSVAQVGNPASDDFVAASDDFVAASDDYQAAVENTLVWTEGGTCSDGGVVEADCDNSSAQVGTPASDDYAAAVPNTLVWTDAVAGSCSDGTATTADTCDNSVAQVGTAASDDYAANSASFTAGVAGSCSDGTATTADTCDNSVPEVGTAASCADLTAADGSAYSSSDGYSCASWELFGWFADYGDGYADSSGNTPNMACCASGSGGDVTPASDDYVAAVPNTLEWTDASADSCSAPTGYVDSCYPNDGACDDGYSWCGYESGVDCTDCGNCSEDVAGWDGSETGCDNGTGTAASDDYAAAVENTLAWTDAVDGSCSDGTATTADTCDNSVAQVGTAASDDYAAAQENSLSWTAVGSCSEGDAATAEECDNSSAQVGTAQVGTAQVGTAESDDYMAGSESTLTYTALVAGSCSDGVSVESDCDDSVENTAVYYAGGSWTILTDGDADDDDVCDADDQCADADDNGGACECAIDTGVSTIDGYYTLGEFNSMCADADGFGATVTWSQANFSSTMHIMAGSSCTDTATDDDGDLLEGVGIGGVNNLISLDGYPTYGSRTDNAQVSLTPGECFVWVAYDWYGYASTDVIGTLMEDTDPALTGCMEPLACNYSEIAQFPADCQFPATGYNCEGECMGVADDPNTDADESQTCGCHDWFALNTDTSTISDPTTCDFTGMVPLTWNLTSGNWGGEIRHLLCTTGDDAACYGFSSGVPNYQSFDISIHLLDDGTTYEILSADSYGDGWDGGFWSITDAEGNMLAGADATEAGLYTSSYTIDTLALCSAGYDCAGVCGGSSVVGGCDESCGSTLELDNCGICGGLNASEDCAGDCDGTFAEGSFAFGQDDLGAPFLTAASADEVSAGWWSLGNCDTFDSSGDASTDNLTFSASCVLISDIFTGSVSMTLELSDVADDGYGTGEMSLQGTNFSTVVTGSVADTTTFPTLIGSLEGFSSGGSYVDNCGDCDADATNDCVADCAGVFEGAEGYGAEVDACGVCNIYTDSNGVAPDFPYGTCDCSGDPNGDLVIDDCGTCGGLNAAQDCFGDCDGIGFLVDETTCAYPAFDAIDDLVISTRDDSDSGLVLEFTFSPVTTVDADDSGYADASYGFYVWDEDYYPDCTGYQYSIGTGYCNADLNNEACGWDGGDCCASTNDQPYGDDNNCYYGYSGYDEFYLCDCQDPDACDSLALDDEEYCGPPYVCGDGVCDTVNGEAGGDSGCYADCGCLEGELTCATGGSYGNCIPGTWACDGASDCADGSDEVGCESLTCADLGQWSCTGVDDGSDCANPNYVCDGSSANGNASWGPDCDNGADEDIEYCCFLDDATYVGAGLCGDDTADGGDTGGDTGGDDSCCDASQECCGHDDCGVGEYCYTSGSGYNYCYEDDCCNWSDGVDADCDGVGGQGDCPQDCDGLASIPGESDFINKLTIGDKLSKSVAQAKYDDLVNSSLMVSELVNGSIPGEINDGDIDGGTYNGTRAGWRQMGSSFYYHYTESGLTSMGFTSSAYGYGDTVGPFMVTSRNNTGQESDPSNESMGTFPILDAPTDLVAVAGEDDECDAESCEFINFSWSYEGYEPSPYASCGGTISYIGDGDCDTYNNNEECGWDGGDCCASTCVPGTSYFCDSPTDTADVDNDGCWDVCYDPDTSCGSGIPDCAVDYSDLNFAVFAGLCYNDSNTYVLSWNDACDGEVWLDGSYLFDVSDFSSPLTLDGYGSSESHLFEYKSSDGVVLASETESTSDEDCDAVSSNDSSNETYNFITEMEMKISNDTSSDYRTTEGFRLFSLDDSDEWTLLVDNIYGVSYQLSNGAAGCYAVAAYDSYPAYQSGYSNSACVEEETCPLVGDSNSDGTINVSDIVLLVGAILNGGGSVDGVECGDMDGSGTINVSDIVGVVNIILGGRTVSLDDATSATLILADNSLNLESNGFVQGVQVTLSHDRNFSIDLVDAYISDYVTSNNMTTLVVVSDGSTSITEIATFNGDCKVEDVHVANSTGDVTVEETVELVSFNVEVAGPNPFNPSTKLNIVVPEAGYVSVKVYNVLGQEVANLVDGQMDASSAGHLVNWNAGNLASGVYIVRATTAGKVSTQKLMLLK